MNPIIAIQTDGTSRSDSGFEYSNTPPSTLHRRTIANSAMFNNRSSNERLSPKPKMVYSHSTNGLNNSTGMLQQNTDDSLDILSSSRSTKSIFDIVTDPQIDNNDSLSDDPDRKSHLSDSMFDDQQFVSSPDKKRKQMLSTKLLKPFQIFRKKSNVS